MTVRALVALSCATVLLTACGGDSAGDTATASRPAAEQQFVSLTEAESVLEAGRLAVVRTGRGEASVAGLDPRPVESARYATQSGRELDVLVFATAAAARDAMPEAVDAADLRGDGSAVRAANVVAVFPRPFPRVDAYRSAARALRDLAGACATDSDSPLSRFCDDGDGADIPPPGEGVDRDEAERVGGTLVVDGLRYRAEIARQLNPAIRPDEELVGGRRPGEDRLWFGVFVRVCNPTGEPRRTSARLALVDAFGKRIEPTELPASNPFSYQPALVEAGECLPRSGSAADRVVEGSLVLFEVTDELLADRPLALEVAGRRLLVDV